MIRMRIPTKSDYKLMAPIIEKHHINIKSLNSNKDEVFIMIEKNKIIGLSEYYSFEEYGVIDLMCYDIDFIDNSYRDAFFRGTLNLILNNGLFDAIILTTKENHKFYENYGFEAVEESLMSSLKKRNLYSTDVIGAFKIDIEAFFNRPCNA